ncbi:hypothetical protein ACKKBG_A22790 [Auxenochlorella protothecoides x Auxenochlorella symbiontica]|uniref:Protein FAM98C n=3 Tax=Auxenochlorella protothecoides TaxID=3075 RepID=A0A087SNA4_AUXPR|nr:Protein FAM98C [Auxenochlorella protothecoides]KFM27208.1 Protein FAM98C [Auxenochlorella protothecoides]RMZ57073.1 hypothetical protein APUTEX25_002305 [Auxenochlorella protothecoides]|eukprot:RMZ57073.1 hypothetical protein APUTEX25_002305 [Auxenochlorella protothecoides]
MEAQAVDLLDRLEDCGLAAGLTEDDLTGSTSAREPLRTACVQLAQRVWALRHHLTIHSHTALQRAVLALGAAAETEAAARGGRLDAALGRLAQALDPGFAPGVQAGGRTAALDAVVSLMQAAALLNEGEAAVGGARTDVAKSADESKTVDGTTASGATEATPSADPADATVVMSAALRALGRLVGADAGGASAVALAEAAAGRVEALAAQLPPGFFDPLLPALPGPEGETLRAALVEVDAALRSEYTLRRAMLKERAAVTLRSLLWSDRLEEPEAKACEVSIDAALAAMPPDPVVSLDEVHAARLGDLYSIMDAATSGAGSGAWVKSVRIGAVPDRGGRVEGRARAAPMPGWTARKAGNEKGKHQHRQKRFKKS